MQQLVARAGLRDGWLTELVSLDFGRSTSVTALDAYHYPRGFFRATITTSADCHPVPSAIQVDTSRIKFEGEGQPDVRLPALITYQIRPRFGVAQQLQQHFHDMSDDESQQSSKRKRADTQDLL